MRYLCAIVDHGLNVSDAAEALHTSQPGISKQIRQLEDELGVRVFVRQGKRLASLTPAGESVVATARRALREIGNLKRVGAEFKSEDQGTLAIATRSVIRPAGHMGAEWRPVGTGDLTATGLGDLVWQSNAGDVAVWHLAGNQLAGFAISTGHMGSEWQLAGLGDFNGDHRSDLFWVDRTGATQVWTMSGPNPV